MKDADDWYDRGDFATVLFVMGALAVGVAVGGFVVWLVIYGPYR
jgi:hypothetical protein